MQSSHIILLPEFRVKTVGSCCLKNDPHGSSHCVGSCLFAGSGHAVSQVCYHVTAAVGKRKGVGADLVQLIFVCGQSIQRTAFHHERCGILKQQSYPKWLPFLFASKFAYRCATKPGNVTLNSHKTQNFNGGRGEKMVKTTEGC